MPPPSGMWSGPIHLHSKVYAPYVRFLAVAALC